MDFKALARKSKTYRAPGKLYYGFGLSYKDIIDYAERHSPIDPSITSAARRYAHARSVTLERLRELCQFNDLETALPISPEYQVVLAMYDNYTIAEFELEEEEEADVIRILQEELPACSRQNPRWFFDRMDRSNGA